MDRAVSRGPHTDTGSQFATVVEYRRDFVELSFYSWETKRHWGAQTLHGKDAVARAKAIAEKRLK